MLVGGAARRLRGRGWPVRDDVSALTGHVLRLVPSLRRLDLLRLLLALHLHRRRRRLPDRQGRLLRSARRSKLQNPTRAQEGQASQTNRFIYCPRQTHCKFRTQKKRNYGLHFTNYFQILTVAALVLTYIVQKSKVLLPQLLNGFEPADHPKLAILNVFMYVLNTLALIGSHYSRVNILKRCFPGVILFASQELNKLNLSLVDPVGTRRKKLAAQQAANALGDESPAPASVSNRNPSSLPARLNRYTDQIQIIRSSTKASLEKTPESHSSSTSGIGSCSPDSSSPGGGSVGSTPPPASSGPSSKHSSGPRV